MRSLLVSGGTGFVGRNLVRRLLADGFRVVCLTRTATTAELGAPTVVIDEGLARALAERGPFDALVHLAGRVNGTEAQLARDNVQVTQAVLEALSAAGMVRRAVYVSSVSAVAPLGAYGAAKRACEEIVARTPDLGDWVVLRPSLIYGRHEKGNVAQLIRAVRRWPLIPVVGGRSVRLQPLYVADLCDAIVAAIAGRGRPRSTYIVAGPRQERLWDMIRILQARVGTHAPLVPVPLKPVQATVGVLDHLLPWLHLPVQQISHLHDHPPWDWSAAATELGFSPRSFEAGIADYLAAG